MSIATDKTRLETAKADFVSWLGNHGMEITGNITMDYLVKLLDYVNTGSGGSRILTGNVGLTSKKQSVTVSYGDYVDTVPTGSPKAFFLFSGNESADNTYNMLKEKRVIYDESFSEGVSWGSNPLFSNYELQLVSKEGFVEYYEDPSYSITLTSSGFTVSGKSSYYRMYVTLSWMAIF